MRNDPSVAVFVARARTGDKAAWAELVERYTPLVGSICRRYRLANMDAADVGQTVWLRLIERLPALREPAALGGWLATTTRRECLRVLRAARRHQSLEHSADLESAADEASTVVDQALLDPAGEQLGGDLRLAPGALLGQVERLVGGRQPHPGAFEAVFDLGADVGAAGDAAEDAAVAADPSQRELQVLRLVTEGSSANEIVKQLPPPEDAEDAATTEVAQGEMVVLPERYAVSPGHGRFYPVTCLRRDEEDAWIEPGDLLGEVRNGSISVPVRSSFRGCILAHLVREGELVTPGQILVSIRPVAAPFPPELRGAQ
jgi:RNA polymerase sigma factor (sigma-70 family)